MAPTRLSNRATDLIDGWEAETERSSGENYARSRTTEVFPTNTDVAVVSAGERARIASAAADACAPSIRRAYAGQWARFDTWCRARGGQALPAAPVLVAAYLTERAETAKIATVRVAAAAIGAAHRAPGADDPTGTPAVRAGIARIARQHAACPEAAPRQAALVDQRDLFRAVRHELSCRWGAPSFLGHGLGENPMSQEVGGMAGSRRVEGAGSARTEGARRATGVGADAAAVGSGALAPGQRWSASRKRDVVLRLLRGEPLDAVSREVGVEVYRLEKWKARALAGLELGLKEQAGEPLAAELDAAKRHIGELSMENELLRSRARAAERRLPLATRRSRR